MPNIWRLLPQIDAPGAMQMALDSWLLEQHLEQHGQSSHPQSVLRFYRWSPAAISLGYHQKEIPDRWHKLAIVRGLDLVRRPSGGRAVLHRGDLTYAVVTSVDSTNSSSSKNRRDIYTHICEFLIEGFAALGIQLDYGKSERSYSRDRNCFATSTSADLVTPDGRKLIGSAQLYRHNSVLQHGSIAIAPDYELLEQVFDSSTPVVGLAELLDAGAITADNGMDSLVERAIAALTEAAKKSFGAQFEDFPQDPNFLEVISRKEVLEVPIC
jgi:lipoate-protein ligase A